LTEAGERLVHTVEPGFEEIDAELEALSALRGKPTGTIRITAGDHAIKSAIWPRLAKFLAKYPDIKVEIIIDHGLTDIAAERYDAGVRWGEQVAKDMIAVRIGPDTRFAVVGAKSYFAKRAPPKTPQDLISHNCINLYLPTYGGLYAWEFERDGRDLNVRVEGQLVFNDVLTALEFPRFQGLSRSTGQSSSNPLSVPRHRRGRKTTVGISRTLIGERPHGAVHRRSAFRREV
jgi:DNA-binding transcriptional LysR family regulator